jgi:hypothetical protein
MAFSAYSQTMNQDQIDLVRRFNRAVTKELAHWTMPIFLVDAPLDCRDCCGKLSRPDSRWDCCVPVLAWTRDTSAGSCAGWRADRLVTTDPDGGDGRVRRVRLTRKGLAEPAVLDSLSNELAASILTPLTAPPRNCLVTAMADVEKLVLASQVWVEIMDPRDIDARYCLRSYFEELGRRFDKGFGGWPLTCAALDWATFAGTIVGGGRVTRNGDPATGD